MRILNSLFGLALDLVRAALRVVAEITFTHIIELALAAM
jgi:hypothetical protein